VLNSFYFNVDTGYWILAYCQSTGCIHDHTSLSSHTLAYLAADFYLVGSLTTIP